jgi:hypothetical protein
MAGYITVTARAFWAPTANQQAACPSMAMVNFATEITTIAVLIVNLFLALSSVLRFSLNVGFENSLVGLPANHSAGARPG